MSKRSGFFELLYRFLAFFFGFEKKEKVTSDEIPADTLVAKHELRDWKGIVVATIFTSLLISGILMEGILGVGFFWWRGVLQRAQYGRSSFHEVAQIPPSPQLQIDPHGDLEDMIEQQRKQLATYHWVNRKAGWVAIPLQAAERRWLREHQSRASGEGR